MLGYLLEEHLCNGLQMACVCIWIGRLNLSGIAETTTMSVVWVERDDDSFVYFRMGYGFPFWQAGGWPDFQSFFWLAGNLCSSLPGSMFDRGFVISFNVDALVSTSGLQERPAKIISQISKHCSMLNLGIRMVKQAIYTTIFLSCAIEQFLTLSTQLNFFAHFTTNVSILIVVLTSSGHWCISLTYIGMIAKPKKSNKK